MRRKMMAAVMAVTMMMAAVACTDRGDVQVLIRKAAGSDDITGDYNDYSETDTAEANGSTVTLRGEDGMVKGGILAEGRLHLRDRCDGGALCRDDT